MPPTRFSHRLRVTPDKPGVYIMNDLQNKVLYVGKAANLKTRLRSYFGSSSGHQPKIQRMLSHLTDFEFIVTDSPSEALILENTLIKKYRPPFNARLKDDKTYPYIKIDRHEDFPQVYVTRRVENDGSTYFGPFATAGSIRKTLALLKRLFPYRSCTKAITGKDLRPCLEFYINRCNAPCIGAISKEQYHKVIDQILLFMTGKTEPVLAELQQKMKESSDNLEFERAAALRDQVRAIRRVAEEQQIKTASTLAHDLDAIALASRNNQACIEIFFVRQGKLVGKDNFIMEGTQGESPGDILAGFVKQFYQSAPFVPRRILLQHFLEDEAAIEEWLRERRKAAVTLVVPKIGANKRLLQMAAENASQHLSQLRVKWWSNTDTLQEAITELQEQLNLPAPPHRIECYDISNIQGTNPVASMVTFEDGVPKPSDYRRFKIRQVPGINDYAMMQEVLRRRFRRLSDIRSRSTTKGNQFDEEFTIKNGTWGIVPELVIIDGGKGHLASALEVFLQMGIDFVPLASIAKENEWLFVPHIPEPIVLPRNSQALHLVQRVRDEAHRFAITYHRKLRSKSSVSSIIDTVIGIGPKRKRTLIRRFGSLKGIKQASVEDIAALPGITRSLATRLKKTI